MLFERIRRTQKPVFVFLAVTFMLGFVLLGVGQGAGSINSLDFLTGGSSSSDPTSSLKDQVAKNPNDAAAWKQLAVAYQGQGKTDDAINAYESYLNLKKTDPSALTAAATLLETRAYYASVNAQNYEAAAQFNGTDTNSSFFSAIKADQLATNPVATAAASGFSTQAQTYQSQQSTDTQVALGYRKILAAKDPKDALNQLGYGYDAANTRDYPTAIKALQTYLKLAPTSTQAPQVKQLIKELQSISGATTTPAG